MLPRTQRITQALFKLFIKKSRFIDGNFLSVRYSPSKDGTRYAFVVPKTVAKTAVARNILRRRGYAAVHTIRILPKTAHLFAFFFKKTGVSPTFTEIQEEVRSLLIKTNAF